MTPDTSSVCEEALNCEETEWPSKRMAVVLKKSRTCHALIACARVEAYRYTSKGSSGFRHDSEAVGSVAKIVSFSG